MKQNIAAILHKISIIVTGNRQLNKQKTKLYFNVEQSCILLNGALWWSLNVNADIFAAQPV